MSLFSSAQSQSSVSQQSHVLLSRSVGARVSQWAGEQVGKWAGARVSRCAGERVNGVRRSDSRLPTPDSQLPTPNSRFSTPDSRLPTPNSQLPTPNSRLPIKLRSLFCIALGTLPLILSATSRAAEQIRITFGPLERSISVSSLEAYAEEGVVSHDLAPYLRYLPDHQRSHLRDLLNTRAEVSHVAVSQFLYSNQGEILLNYLGEFIQTDARLNGNRAIRATLILAAADPDKGLTPINALRQFPLEGIRIDVERTLRVIEILEGLINQTAEATAMVAEQARQEAAVTPFFQPNLPDLRQAGQFRWQRETLQLEDPQRDRTFMMDLYLPSSAQDNPFPVIVISHGVGSDRTSYAYLAQHLASQGFAVAVPEHPGSDAAQIQALIQGRANEVVDPNEFINRPLDIHYLLDHLEVLNQTAEPIQGRLDLQRVGVVGQSLGGYTALTLAGAELNLRQLSVDCIPSNPSLNLSLLLQCRARDAAEQLANFQDDRVRAVIAINPIGSSTFGRSGFAQIDRPVMVVSGNADTVAPALPEQIRPFTWLNHSDRYLVLMRGATHFSTIGSSDNEVSLPEPLVGPDPAIAHRYMKAISTAFFMTHVADQPDYAPLLGSAYANRISQEQLPLHLIRSLNVEQLTQGLNIDEEGTSSGS